MRRFHLVAAAALVAGLAGTASSQSQESIDACYDSSDQFPLAAQLAGCTALIESGRYSGTQLADIYYNRAYVRGEQEDYSGAIIDYDRAAELNPGDASTFFNRGNMYAQLKDEVRAIADYNEATRLNPRHAKAFLARARIEQRWGRQAEADADFARARELNPDLFK